MQASDGKNRPSETRNDFGHGELARVDGELVASDPTAPALDDAVPPEVEQDDGEEFRGDAFTFRELRDGNAAWTRASDAREGPDAVGRLAVQDV